MRGWWTLYRTSLGLGVRALARGGPRREGVTRLVIPLDPSRYLELPWALDHLGAREGERVLDLASPKLVAVALARRGVEVTSVDAFAPEVDTWRRLAGREPRLRFEVADGRALPFEDGSFDRAYSISVLEHVADDGDAQALRELERVVRPGGRIVLTLPYAREARDEWRDRPLYGEGEGPAFFQRWYDDGRLASLLAAAPELRVAHRSVVRLAPNWQPLYDRLFPWLVALGPVYGLLAREVEGPGGDVVRIALDRYPAAP
ncbi:MAG: methyltransferase domain-containing protein [Pseudomonadota bacterium]